MLSERVDLRLRPVADHAANRGEELLAADAAGLGVLVVKPFRRRLGGTAERRKIARYREDLRLTDCACGEQARHDGVGFQPLRIAQPAGEPVRVYTFADAG